MVEAQLDKATLITSELAELEPENDEGSLKNSAGEKKRGQKAHSSI